MRILSSPCADKHILALLTRGAKVVILSYLFIPFFIQAVGLSDVKKIDINSAPLEDLLEIIHIGEARAKELISLRPFFSLDDLVRIKGISETRVKDIKKQGLAWVETEALAETKETSAQAEKDFKEELATAATTTGEKISKKLPFLPFFTAFLLAIFSGIIILSLKKSVEKVYNKNI